MHAPLLLRLYFSAGAFAVMALGMYLLIRLGVKEFSIERHWWVLPVWFGVLTWVVTGH